MNVLSIIWNVDPTIFSIGPLSVNYYPIFFIIGFYPIGYNIVKSFFKREGVPVDLLDPLLWSLLIGAAVGARLGHVMFYDPVYYLQHPWEIPMTWKGGLASHGGAVGVLISLWWFAHKYGKKHGFDYMWILDRVVIPVCFAGMFIRLGNLFNSEIYGNPTDLPWGFIFERNGETLAKHPTQLYEALVYLCLGISLIGLYWKCLPRLKKGTIFGIFLIVLFGGRFLIEYVKEPQSSFEVGMFFNMGQILSMPFMLAGIIILVWSLTKAGSAMAEISASGNLKNKGPKAAKPKSTELKYSKSKSE